MASFEKLSVRSSETLRQWFKKLQNFIPGSFIKSDSKSHSGKLLICKPSDSYDVFPSQKNLDVIMDTLRKDMLAILRSSRTNKSVTAILFKLNTLDNNIREACRFQHTWINHPISGRESLKVQEKYIVRLIEEIMDDIIEVNSALKRGMKHMSYNERSINGVISVLAILKREVCNMINIAISSIDSKYLSQLKGTSVSLDSNSTTIDKYAYPYKKSNESCLSNVNMSTTEISNPIIKNTYSEEAPVIPNSKSYPEFKRKKGSLFSSLQNVSCVNTENPLRANHKHLIGPTTTNFKESYNNFKECTRDKHLKSDSSKSCFNLEEITNGSGDTDQNFKIPCDSFHSSQHEDYISQNTPKTIESYFAYEETKDNNTKRNKIYIAASYPKHDENYNMYDIDTPKKVTSNENEKKLHEEPSLISWPSATVVRDIKSDYYLNSYSRHDPSKCRNLYTSSWAHDIPSDNVSSDSDSDDSYISCELDHIGLGTCFLSHVKEQFIQRPFEMLMGNNRSLRDKTDSFSCKSAKMSEIFTGEKGKGRNALLKPDTYYSVESIPCINHDVDGATECKLTGLRKEITCLDASVCTDPEMLKKKICIDEPTSPDTSSEVHFFDFNNTLALSDPDFYRPDYLKSISPAVSLTSVSSELVNYLEDHRHDYRSTFDKQSTAVSENDVEPNLEDSQFSSVCLTMPPSNHKLTGRVGDEFNLMAIEV